MKYIFYFIYDAQITFFILNISALALLKRMLGLQCDLSGKYVRESLLMFWL